MDARSVSPLILRPTFLLNTLFQYAPLAFLRYTVHMTEHMTTEERILVIEERNERVQADKAWETSLFRKLLITCITYGVASFVLYEIGAVNFYLGAIIPALGFLLSTLTLPSIKRWWIKTHFRT